MEKEFLNEEWKPVVGYEELLEVSTYGRVRSVTHYIHKKDGTKQIVKGKILSPRIIKIGYYAITLSFEAKHKTLHVHRLVAKAFIPNPYNLPCINHKDENKTNNNFDNLEWCTRKYNNAYGTAVSRRIQTLEERGFDFGGKKVLQYKLNGEFIAEYNSLAEAGRNTGIIYPRISNCCNGKVKQAGGFQWKFKDDNRRIENILPIIQMDSNGKEINRFISVREASEMTGTSKKGIDLCIKGVYKTSGGCKWKRLPKLYLNELHYIR